ncbi:MAG TPA: DUF892 family protein [Micromonospora sp.]
MNTVRDLFFYELAIMIQMERSGSVLLSMLIARRVQDANLERTLHGIEQDGHRHVDKINACLQDLGTFSLQTQAASVDGISSDFEHFMRMQPAPELLDLYALDTAKRFSQLAVVGYTDLVDSATALGHETCAERLRSNLTEKAAGLRRLDSSRHEVRRRILVTTG